ncbi:MAG: DUF1566 domain-containing protein [Sulfurospirillaceae bacterium]|nr:DUF1566 domain-containing protein [Sulfurospirillaceae bacterium]
MKFSYLICVVAFLASVSQAAPSAKKDVDSGVFKDRKAPLLWQDNAYVEETRVSWEGAKKYCEELKLAGFKDWRLPTVEELRGLNLQNQYLVYSHEGFYWSSTENSQKKEYIDAVNLSMGIVMPLSKELKNQNRCVRTIK